MAAVIVCSVLLMAAVKIIEKVAIALVCIGRQFTCSVSKADYLALRNGFINAHIGMDTDFNFHKFLRRCLDEDFKVLVTIRQRIRSLYKVASSLCDKLLLAIGAKLEAIISQMCLKGSSQTVVILGKVTVHPNDKLFWFGRPRWLLYAVQFILIENSFQLAYILWDLYTFGYHSCLHRETEDFALFLGSSIVVQIVCAYITLPLYALMGSSMKEAIFSEQVVAGLKHWHNMAKKNVSTKESINTLLLQPHRQ
ncbi:hypothetical protein HPP92_021326 [Vanilla planifolia]|uniref:MLO-like protein n=1 Tax=Vanilla planifolia TaxID=51239 RepID=A0A835UJB6_VANPL|nr:hypothetical protein HPP92_021326 [Vanilla planifolia]